MRKHCFTHLKGFNEELETQMYNLNIFSYSDLFSHLTSTDAYFRFKKQNILQIKESHEALKYKNWSYFNKKIATNEHYKMLNFSPKIAFIDIETTGLSKEYHYITTIGIYDGNKSRIFVNGKDLEEAFYKLQEYDIIVTFNGKQFDVPFIEHYAKQKINCIHLDLRFMLKEFGLSGGLKRIERDLGLTRDSEVAEIDGFEAIRLWNRYQKGDLEALELLKKYNTEDIENLEYLLNWYLEKKGFSIPKIEN